MLEKFIISRSDNIGDVVLTIPLAGLIKKTFPHAQVIFLGKKYTKPVIDTCTFIDDFIDADILHSIPTSKAVSQLKKLKADCIIHVFPNYRLSYLSFRAGIPVRIGTGRRWYHRLFVNEIIPLSRKKSTLHESQLNLMLLQTIIPDFRLPNLADIPQLYGMQKMIPLPDKLKHVIETSRMNVIIHPKSKGSAREWGLDNFSQLVQMLEPEKYNVIISGTDYEAGKMEGFLKLFKNRAHDLTGKLDLSEYISLIAESDALVAASTGPLHIAAATGINAIGLYAPMKPIFPQRWAPIGLKSEYLVLNKECNKCKKDLITRKYLSFY
ncbi:MAG: glycosyl transferase family 9 [Bacteroidetes bacterium HGW-Bacteroidetes-21]|nr:MAG: glycosyl transferase family 9 [Bacteroidetes bacterium HGW-Bacteroidetes-21]